ncbi:hypothetical protein [Roseibium album]|uniref:hypothetical protein n=1 Tax=Roseibium album TaxID=311410 RepID=UPI00329A35FD
MGGEYDDWKEAAKDCDEVQAEIETPSGKLVLKRNTASKTEPVHVFFGSLSQAAESSLDGCERFPLHRTRSGKEGFSQVMFRSMLIPEAQSEGASNITMHQILRLCYSDQRTPATRLFRFENFDTQNIREAVGDLICGISGYELYELTLTQRDQQNQYDAVSAKLSALVRSVRSDSSLNSPAAINGQVIALDSEREKLSLEIDAVDEHIESGEVKEYLAERASIQKTLISGREKLSVIERTISTTEFELREIEEFSTFLETQSSDLSKAEGAFKAVGFIEFTHCPACGEELTNDVTEGHCVVCKSPRDPEREKSRYNQIRLDLEIQTRETKQLLEEKKTSLARNKQDLRKLRSEHEDSLREFSLRYSGKNGPRESYLAIRTSRIGHIDAEIKFLIGQMEIAEEIEQLSLEKERLNSELDRIKDRIASLRKDAAKRRGSALTHTGNIAASLLRQDLPRQPEFIKAESVKLDFQTDSMEVDGILNFAESSNVFLKNASIFSLFLAAGRSAGFYHPSFLLFDNIEDKGMQEERSHLFQRLIVEHATEITTPYQVIFTTSMMNPELELDDYVIGPAYTNELRSLDLGY